MTFRTPAVGFGFVFVFPRRIGVNDLVLLHLLFHMVSTLICIDEGIPLETPETLITYEVLKSLIETSTSGLFIPMTKSMSNFSLQ